MDPGDAREDEQRTVPRGLSDEPRGPDPIAHPLAARDADPARMAAADLRTTPIVSHRGPAGRAIGGVKRLLRRLLRPWLVDAQSDFNEQVSHAIWSQGRRLDRLTTEVEKLVGFTAFEDRLFSQNGEDGVISEILRRIGAPVHWFVEFGAEDGQEGNCVALAHQGWPGLFLEADPARAAVLAARWAGRPAVVTRCCTVTPSTIESEFTREAVPAEPAIVSIDADGPDWHIWRSLVSYRPRLVVIEYNSCLPLDSQLVQPLDLTRVWDGTDYFGASLGAMEELGMAKGYRLVHTDQTGVNAFFVRADLMAGTSLPEGEQVQRHSANYFGTGQGHPRDPQRRPWLDLAADGEDGVMGSAVSS